MKSIIRKVLLVALVLITSLGLSAQIAKYDKQNEEILVDGEYYAKLVKSKHNSNGIGLIKNFSIQNREGEELIFLKYRSYKEWDSRIRTYIEKPAYDITFINGLGTVNIKKQFTVNSAMELVISNNLILNDKVDPEAENRFISVNRGTQGNNQEVKGEISDIDISNNDIIKEGNNLGKFTEKTKINNAGVEQTIINIYLSSGEKIATARADLKDPSEWSVYTVSDDKTTDILYEKPFSKEKLFNWLISKKHIK